jgi:hypothetical protein
MRRSKCGCPTRANSFGDRRRVGLDGDVDGHEHRLPRRAQLLRHDRADIRSVRLITTAMPALTRSSLRRGGSGCVDSVGEGG